MAMDSTAPAPPGRAPRRSQLAAARAGPQARRTFFFTIDRIHHVLLGPWTSTRGRPWMLLSGPGVQDQERYPEFPAARRRSVPRAISLMYISVSWSMVTGLVCRVVSAGLAQMIIGIRCRRSSRNPRKDTTNHVSKCRVSGRESIFDLRITLQPRAAHPIPKLIKGQARPSETTAARRTHARARPAHQEKEPPQ